MAAPTGLRELVEAPGEGFGPLAHPTTSACLSLIHLLPKGPALDAGCGSGLLAQAWRALDRGPVLALDADPRAIHHARASLLAAGRSEHVTLERARIETLSPTTLASCVVLANLPPPGHRALLERIGSPPPAALVSGPHRGEIAPLIRRYVALGLRPVGVRRAGRWEAWALLRDARGARAGRG